MSNRISGNSLFAQAASGLSSSYYYLSLLSGSTSGLTLDNILHPDSDDSSTSAIYLNSTFAQYLAKNFNYIDTDGDGTITESDITSYSTKLYSTGLTYSQLAQLCSQSGSSTLYETVLNNFSEIDANCDGRVTSAEISAYSIDCAKQEKQDEYRLKAASNMSIFYGSDSSSDDTYSILSYKYKDVTDS